MTNYLISKSGGKAGGHEPPLFPLPGHILAFSLPAAMSHHYFPFRTTTFDLFLQKKSHFKGP